MTRETVQIPIRTHENFGDSISKLIKTLLRISEIRDDEIILDFSRTKILNPFFLCGLTCVMRKMQWEGRSFILNHDENLRINSYLNTVFFPGTFCASDHNNTVNILGEIFAEDFHSYYLL